MSLKTLLLVFWRELQTWGPPCGVVRDCTYARCHSMLKLFQTAREVSMKYDVLPRIPPPSSMAHPLHVCRVRSSARFKTSMSPHLQRILMAEVSAAPSIASPPGGSRRSRRVLLRFATPPCRQSCSSGVRWTSQRLSGEVVRQGRATRIVRSGARRIARLSFRLVSCTLLECLSGA